MGSCCALGGWNLGSWLISVSLVDLRQQVHLCPEQCISASSGHQLHDGQGCCCALGGWNIGGWLISVSRSTCAQSSMCQGIALNSRYAVAITGRQEHDAMADAARSAAGTWAAG